jgi:hypothetical protein
MRFDNIAGPDRVKQLKIVVYAVLWLVWAAIPIIVLLALNPLVGPRGLLWLTVWWHPLVWIWAISLVILFLWMLRLVDHHDHSARTAGIQFTLGILCSLSLGLPSILLGAVPFFTLDMISLQQLLPHGNIVDLRGSNEGVRSSVVQGGGDGVASANVYIVGIDVSDSFNVPSYDTPTAGKVSSGTNAMHHEAPIDLATRTILDLFGDKGILGQTRRPNDVLMIWIFAGAGSRRLYAHNRGSSYEKEQILHRLAQNSFQLDVKGHRTEKSAVGTDIVGFLQAALDELPPDYHQAKILIFSDLQHLEAYGSHESPGKRRDAIDEKIEQLAERINGDPRLTVMALVAGRPSRSRENVVVRDVRARFDGLLGPRSWQSDELERFRSRDDVEKKMQLVGLYDQVVDTGTIYLKYVTAPINRPVASFLLVNDTSTRMVVGLQARESARPDGDTPPNMRVTIGNGLSRCSLELNGGEKGARELNLLNDVGDVVPVILDIGLVRGNPQANLLVAVSPTTIYRIPISILAVDPSEVKAVETLDMVLLALNLLSVGLALHSVVFMRRSLFP